MQQECGDCILLVERRLQLDGAIRGESFILFPEYQRIISCARCHLL